MAPVICFNGPNSGIQVGDNHGQITISENFSADQTCLRDLQTTNPRHDKDRIETAKGGLLRDVYNWILEHADFEQWRYGHHSRLLWIKGDPGKGKTMLLCGIIDELTKSALDTTTISFFFCQGTDARINHATAVLRGLIFMLVDKQPSLISHVRRLYDKTGKQVFEDVNAWQALSEMLTCILKDPLLETTYLVIDALDECTMDRNKLLILVAQQSSAYPHVKWIVSSRNWPDIEETLDFAAQKTNFWLELNKESISTAVTTFININVQKLTKKKKYNDQIRDTVSRHLLLNAHGTFLWVALVCEMLADVPKRNVRKKLEEFPSGLDRLYERMLDQISDSDDADVCKSILSVMMTVYRPITLEELASYIDLSGEIMDDLDLADIIGLCGSFLTLQERKIYLVHQSAKDFLHRRAVDHYFSDGKDNVHYAIFSNSLQAMSRTLKCDIYGLVSPGYSIDSDPQSISNSLAAIQYACEFWVDHLDSCSPINNELKDLKAGGLVDAFFHSNYLQWLEALSLMKLLSKGVASIVKLESLLKTTAENSQLLDRVRDAYRFLLYHRAAIEHYPLQVYASGLIFSPARSITRIQFEAQGPTWIIRKPIVEESWSACLQTLEGHSDAINSVTFSHDSALLASASDDETIIVWDANSGQCLKTLEGHGEAVYSVAFSHDSMLLASGSRNNRESTPNGICSPKVWDTNSGQCLQTLYGHLYWVTSVSFSHDSTLLASASDDETIMVWDISSGEDLDELGGRHKARINSVTFSHDSKLLASGSDDKTIKVWDASSGKCLQTLNGHSHIVKSVAFSYDSKRLASASRDQTIKIWDTSSGESLLTLKGHSAQVTSVTFSCDSKLLASASGDRSSPDSSIKIWDASSGQCLQTLDGHSAQVNSVAFSHDSKHLASASRDKTIKIWDTSKSGQYLQTPFEGHSDAVKSVVISHDSERLASASGTSHSKDHSIKLWDVSSGQCLKTFKGQELIESAIFSPDSRLLAFALDNRIVVWDAKSGQCLQNLEGHEPITFSHNSKLLAFASDVVFPGTYSLRGHLVNIWDANSGICRRAPKGHDGIINSFKFSHDSKLLASVSDDKTIKVWDSNSRQCLQVLGHDGRVHSVTFSSDSKRLASASGDYFGYHSVKFWDVSSGQRLRTLEDCEGGDRGIVESVTLSSDSKRLASASLDGRINVWDTSTGQCLQTLHTERSIQVRSFDITNSFLDTDVGTICLPSFSKGGPTRTYREALRFKGYSITSDCTWITWNSEKVLWLPPEYRPSSFTMSQSTICLGCHTGRVLLLTFDPLRHSIPFR